MKHTRIVVSIVVALALVLLVGGTAAIILSSSYVALPTPNPKTSAQPVEASTPPPAAQESPSSITTYGTAIVTQETPLFAQRGDGIQLATLEVGTRLLLLLEEDDTLWRQCQMPNGTKGYAHTGDMARIQENGLSTPATLDQELLQTKLTTLREQFPDGKYWNHMGIKALAPPTSVTNKPCEHVYDGEDFCNIYNGSFMSCFPHYDYLTQCLGYGNWISDQLFSKGDPTYFVTGYDSIHVGDHLRMNEYEHSVIVVEMTSDALTVTEVNADYEDCLISWSRSITREEFEEMAWDIEIITRYPYRNSEGTILPNNDQEAKDNHQEGVDAITTFYENSPYTNSYSDSWYEEGWYEEDW